MLLGFSTAVRVFFACVLSFAANIVNADGQIAGAHLADQTNFVIGAVLGNSAGGNRNPMYYSFQ